MSKITVLIPMYNVEKYISKCLDSMLSQTFRDFEVWAVSDGSKDNSAEIVKKYAYKDTRIKLIEKENGGYGSVLQYGINNISTKYFLICDPDDWLAPTALQELYDCADKNKLDIVVGDKYDVYESASPVISRANRYNMQTISPMQVYDNLSDVQLFSYLDVTPHAKLYKTSTLSGINFPNKVSYTDFVLYMLALKRAKRVLYYNKPLAYYLKERPGNTYTDVRPVTITYYLVVWHSVMKQLECDSDIKAYTVLLNRMFRQLIDILIRYKDMGIHNFKDENGRDILSSFNYMSRYRKYINKSKYKLFLYGKLSNLIIKEYVMVNGRH